MNLKLAEYNLETGKFERILNIGKDFLYCGDSIIVCECSIEELIKYMDPIFIKDYFKKDEKDPLNRFDGRFNNKSYGNGRFILIDNNEEITDKEEGDNDLEKAKEVLRQGELRINGSVYRFVGS